LDNLEGEMATATGRMRVSPTSARFRLLSGRPVCPDCGGPLFVDDWKTVRTDLGPDYDPDLDDPDDGDEEVSRLAAA
jgi:hypothetical protein